MKSTKVNVNSSIKLAVPICAFCCKRFCLHLAHIVKSIF